MGYMGFKAVQSNVEASGKSPAKAAAIAASIGRKKYGAKKFAAMGAAGRKGPAKAAAKKAAGVR